MGGFRAGNKKWVKTMNYIYFLCQIRESSSNSDVYVWRMTRLEMQSDHKWTK